MIHDQVQDPARQLGQNARRGLAADGGLHGPMRRRYEPPRDLRPQSEAMAEESVPAARGVQGHTAQSMGHVQPRGCARGHGRSVARTLQRDAQSRHLADRKTPLSRDATACLGAVRLPISTQWTCRPRATCSAPRPPCLNQNASRPHLWRSDKAAARQHMVAALFRTATGKQSNRRSDREILSNILTRPIETATLLVGGIDWLVWY